MSERPALDALLRRLSFAVRDELSIAERPAGGALLGRYGLAGRAPKKARGAPIRRGPPYDIIYGTGSSCNNPTRPRPRPRARVQNYCDDCN